MVHPIAWVCALALVGCGGLAVVDTAGSTASDGGGGAGGQASCDDLETEFGTALAQARQCDPAASSPQCTQQVASALTCGCRTYVNPSNSAALATLSEIEAEWDAMGCELPVPCPFGCPAPQGSACLPGTASESVGSCEDLFL